MKPLSPSSHPPNPPFSLELAPLPSPLLPSTSLFPTNPASFSASPLLQEEEYVAPFKNGDVLTVTLDLSKGTVGFSRNGQPLGEAFRVREGGEIEQ